MSIMKLVLADGREFVGTAYGSCTPVVGEIVFNTSMVGYQEIVSDPAYAGQIVIMTYPLMGQYGIMDEDFESKGKGIAGLVTGDYCDTPSNFRYTKTLSEHLEERSVPCLSGIDTRMLTAIVRDEGSMIAAIVDSDTGKEQAMEMIRAYRTPASPAVAVSCTKRWFSRTPHHSFDVVILDCGLKHSVTDELNMRGCNVTVVPCTSSAGDILALNPDGLMVCGGPGDPSELTGVIAVIRELEGKLPIFGINLGHCLIALACGARTFKLSCGYHGGRPVREIPTGRIISAEHSCNYAVDAGSVAGSGLQISYTDVCEGGVEGLVCPGKRICSVQFNPEGAPGPRESHFFDDFIKAMEG